MTGLNSGVSQNHRWMAALALCGATAALAAGALRAQEPTFRAGVDVVAVDVQVVDGNGVPIEALTPDKFTVTIDGRKRKVVSANFIRNSDLPRLAGHPLATNDLPDDLNGADVTGPGRTFVIAVDENSFDVPNSRGVVLAAESFLRQLNPNDEVGLYAFPFGPTVNPTTDHALIERRLDTIVGHKGSVHSEYNLTPMEVIDITAEDTRSSTQAVAGRGVTVPNGTALVGNEGDTLRRVQDRECGTDTRCVEEIQIEAHALAFYYESQVTQSLDGLRSLVQNLQEYPGRKTVVMLSGGMVVSDRPGGRPDVGDLPKLLGQEAAQADTTIYALHVDTTLSDSFSAETRKADKTPVSKGRDRFMLSRVEDQFSGASGGALLDVLVGSGEVALTRVLRETSSHYLLGVEPVDADRDGRLKELHVSVNAKGVTVRSRLWVLVPKKPV